MQHVWGESTDHWTRWFPGGAVTGDDYTVVLTPWFMGELFEILDKQFSR